LGQPNCKYLQGNTPQMWNEYLDYLLGPYTYKLYARDAYGGISAEPPWNLLLSYELETRRKMVGLMSKGTEISAALPAAWKDSLTKERFFVTPLAVGSSSKRPALALKDQEANPAKKPTRAERQKEAARLWQAGKGRGKGKGNGKRTAMQAGCTDMTPDGKIICYAFNNKQNPCTSQKCTYLRLCGRCFKDHPMWSPQCSA